ncbi:hypothetical protein [Sphingosinicella ginsenosidimutans]|uniref:hypothetical protein n=1 Tax=Allosphingosinicella ginsenosidimutans TaxID=1176539 RepID=UPI00195FFD4B|nr:hypothetical protein [Sphingosinicella ginsenosidimutans]
MAKRHCGIVAGNIGPARLNVPRVDADMTGGRQMIQQASVPGTRLGKSRRRREMGKERENSIARVG